MNLPKRQLKKSPVHSSQTRLAKQGHGSLETRDENTRQNIPIRKSKDKTVKQPSTAILRAPNDLKKSPMITAYQTNGRRSAANVHEVEFSLVDRTNDYRQLYYDEKQVQQAKAIGKSYSQKQFQSEPEGRSRTLQDEVAVANSISTRSIIFTNGGTAHNPLKCHNHQQRDGKYVVDLNEAEDIVCCEECAPLMMKQGLHVEDMATIKCPRSYELDEFLQRSLHSMEALKKCLYHLPEYQRQLTAELTEEMAAHDNYYQHLIGLIQQRQEESQRVLIKSLNSLSDYFNGLHNQLHERLNELEVAYSEITVNREEFKKMTETEFQRALACETARLILPKVLTAPQLEVWKVEIGDFSQFEKDLERYIVRIDQSAPVFDHNSHANSMQSVTESIEVPAEEESALFCQEEFEWGYKPPKPATAKDKDIYFSFEKKSSEESVASPAFKQI